MHRFVYFILARLTAEASHGSKIISAPRQMLVLWIEPVICAGRPNEGLVRIVLPEGVREAQVPAPLALADGAIPVWLVDGGGPEPRTATTQFRFAYRDPTVDALP